MGAFTQEIITILTTPPGNLTYHLVVTFSVVGALLAAINHWRASQYPQDKRLVIGLSLLLGLRLLLLVLAGIAWQGLINDHFLLPPVDRAVSLISLILIIWLWAFPEPSRMGDSASLLLGMLVLIATALNFVWWYGQSATLLYNGSVADTLGGILAVVLILAGGLLIFLRKPNGWTFGLAMLSLFLIGILAYLLIFSLRPEGNYAGIVRLAEMAAYPLLLVLPQRFPLPSLAKPGSRQVEKPVQRRYAADPALLGELLALGSETHQDNVYQSIASAVSQAMLADICLVVLPPTEDGELIFPSGYDLIREEPLDGFSLDGGELPEIAGALRAGASLSLPASSTSTDLNRIAASLHLEHSGHLVEMPILSSDAQPLLGIILLSPLSNRFWSREDQEVLEGLAGRLAYLLQHSQVLYELQSGLEGTQASLLAAQEEIEQVRAENRNLLAQSEATQETGSVDRSQAGSLAALILAHEEAQELIARLRADNEQLRLSSGGPIQEQGEILDPELARIQGSLTSEAEHLEYLEGELRLALEEVAYLRAGLSQADEKMLTYQKSDNAASITSEETEDKAAIIQELRRPMSSIIGYTELLLGESLGILGEKQQKFLERIKISSHRLNKLIDELADLTTPPDGRLQLISETIDLNEVIDIAVDQTQYQLRKKNIVLRVDVPADLPKLCTDRVSLGQALTNLLENAGEVTSPEGEITLGARLQNGDIDREYMLLQISDQGGGIPPENMPYVFSRVVHAEGSPVQGVGDKHAGLSIVRMLVENLGGRIWVDSEPGVGATYSILLPLTPKGSSGNGSGVGLA